MIEALTPPSATHVLYEAQSFFSSLKPGDYSTLSAKTRYTCVEYLDYTVKNMGAKTLVTGRQLDHVWARFSY